MSLYGNKNLSDSINLYSNWITGSVAVLSLLLIVLETAGFPSFLMPYSIVFNKLILILFLSDTCIRIIISPDKKTALKQYVFELAAFFPILRIFSEKQMDQITVLSMLAIILTMLVTRTRHIALISSNEFKPAWLMISSFLIVIFAGAVVLAQPFACMPGKNVSLLNALFTSTSAVCVTGLTVYDTATHFSRAGQIVILLLIQLGGFGIMTFSVFLVVMLGRKLDIKHRIVMQDVLNRDELTGAVRTMRFIIKMTIFVEAAGAIMLTVQWYPRFGSISEAAYHAVFHSVSAFCNAGFSTFSDSLNSFSSDYMTNFVIMALIIAGTLGFMAVLDIAGVLSMRLKDSRLHPRLRIQTVIVLVMTVLLTVLGALGILAFENTVYKSSNGIDTITVALFQSVSCRTAGFTTCDIGILSPATLFLMIILMFIGGAPGSTAGGIKMTTIAVLWRTMISGIHQSEYRKVEILKRTIPSETIQKAITLLLFYLILLSVFTMAMLVTENQSPIAIVFEVVSAGATVGLSTGITPELTSVGRIFIMVLMFAGRLGLLTIGYALVMHRYKAEYTYAEERVMIG
ncbi:MAG: TrkH family potassium uptake protein [Fibrobacterota bacterium]|nr:TrkH family potassium uptake protein [Chitinispirillaceae bacterium]